MRSVAVNLHLLYLSLATFFTATGNKIGCICVALYKVAKESTMSKRADRNMPIAFNNCLQSNNKLKFLVQGNGEVKAYKVTFTIAEHLVRRPWTVIVDEHFALDLAIFGYAGH
jgi:hypothetical protein